MLSALKYLLLLGALLKCGYCQVVVAPGAAVGGFGGGGFIFAFLPIILFLFLLLQQQIEDTLENSCAALFEDVEIAATQTTAIENCEDCTNHQEDEEECNADSNCDYEEGTCFVSGDYTATQTCCSRFFTGTTAEECQTCVGFTVLADCTGDAECAWIEATESCFLEV